MSREDLRELNRNVKESGQVYINALVAYHHALKVAEAAQYKLALERRCVEDAHERNEHWLQRRTRFTEAKA
jgi:predicted metal-dependent hydrolase